LRQALYFAEAVVLGQWLMEQRFTHVHSHYAPMVALLVSRVFPVTFSMTVHGPDEFTDPKGGALREKIAGAALSVAISNFARSQMMMHSSPRDWPRVAKCYLGVPDSEDPQANLAADASSVTRFLCVGRLAPVKGQHILLEAAARLAGTRRDFLVTIAGGGPELTNLRDLARKMNLEDVLRVPGFVTQEDLNRLYREADVFVLPSFAEGVPGVLMEAMREGKPCIATYVNGVPELIEHEVSGLLVTPADEDALARAMVRLMDDPALRHAIGHAGRERVAAEFNLRKNVEKLAGLFEAMLATKPAD
jgi:glycosyltransferase involved in cell wall biosynthesis